MDESLDQLLAICEAAAREGGRELLAWRGRFSTREKAVSDFVTDADLASQNAIRRVIQQAFPRHAFIGEEQVPDTIRVESDRICWVVDPLDGTTNYVHDYPHFAVSVAAVNGGNLLAGVVFDPMADKCFSAAAGQGASCNGRKIVVGTAKDVGSALIAVSLPARVKRESPDLADLVAAAQICRGVRRTGSAALNFAYVAHGSLDAFWATHIHPWDVAAGVLLVREAGGMVTGRDGSDFDLWNPHFLAAANGDLHAGLLKALTPFRRE